MKYTTVSLLDFNSIGVPNYISCLRSGISHSTQCFKGKNWALYYVCLFLITFLASPPATCASYLGLAGDLVIVLVCAFFVKLHWF